MTLKRLKQELKELGLTDDMELTVSIVKDQKGGFKSLSVKPVSIIKAKSKLALN